MPRFFTLTPEANSVKSFDHILLVIVLCIHIHRQMYQRIEYSFAFLKHKLNGFVLHMSFNFSLSLLSNSDC